VGRKMKVANTHGERKQLQGEKPCSNTRLVVTGLVKAKRDNGGSGWKIENITEKKGVVDTRNSCSIRLRCTLLFERRKEGAYTGSCLRGEKREVTLIGRGKDFGGV